MGVGAFQKHVGYFQAKVGFVVLADDDEKPWVSLRKEVQGLVISEGLADEHHNATGVRGTAFSLKFFSV